jgi:Tol biopolymer transport system component
MVAWVGERDLYVMPSAGGEPRVVYSGDLTDRQRLGWSADGKQIGFFTYDLTTIGVEKAWAVPVEGGEPTLITTLNRMSGARGPTYERTVQWSPDGHWVVVGAVDNTMRLFRWPLDGPQPLQRDIAGGEPDWSPDSRTLLYTESLNGAVLIYGVLEAEATPFRNEELLVGTGLGEYAQGPGPLWSPASAGADSDLLVYRTRTASGEPSVAVRTRGGRDLQSLRPNTNNPAWSPNGDSLVVETGTLKADALGPMWAPNGLAIADVSITGEHPMRTLVQNAKWPAWGK